MPALQAGDFEFVELLNITDLPIDLADAEFTAGIAFDFGGSAIPTLNPGEYVLLAKDIEAFERRYGGQMPLAGEFTSSLDNSGEPLLLVDRFGEVILDFAYNDSGACPGRPDGNGSSLEVLDTGGDYSDGDNWRSSVTFGGSPGRAGTEPVVDVVVNEVLTHTDEPLTDAIELHNTTGADVDVGGWFLSDSEANFQKFQIPAGTTIPAGGYVVFDESHFNPGLGTQPTDFALSGAYGDEVWLLAGQTGGGPTRFVDHVKFPAAANGESFGRWPNAAGDLYPMQARRLGLANAGPRVGPLVISEINYNSGEPEGADDFEFVEVFNPTPAPVVLTEWRVRGGVDFDFAAGTSLAAWEALVVVSFNPTAPANAARTAAFRVRYGLDASVQLVGGYSGKLDNAGETVRLERPDEPPLEAPTFVPHLNEDEVAYRDELPWPASADGAGNSLHRIGTDTWGHDVASWAADLPSPGWAVRPPEASDDAYDVLEDVRLTVAAPGVLANDARVGDAIASLVSGPSHGQLSLAADGSFTYDGERDFHGTDTFTYKVNVNQVDSKPATVTITVAPVNDAPVAAAGADQAVFDQDDDWQARVDLDGSASSDDEAGLTLSWWLAGRQVGAGATPEVTLALGEHTILLRATDAAGETDVDQVVVTVEAPLGMAPLALTSPAAAQEVDPAAGSVLVQWAGHGQDATLDLWALGATGWVRYATAVPAAGGWAQWDPSAAVAGWWLLSADIERGGVHIESTGPAPIKLVPQTAAPAAAGQAAVAEQAIVLTSPARDVQVARGQSLEVRWDLASPSASVQLVYVWVRNEADESTPVSPAVDVAAGAFTWDTAVVAAGRYRIELRWLGEDGAWGSALSSAWAEVL
jgi:VCBS repeat-containing protein